VRQEAVLSIPKSLLVNVDSALASEQGQTFREVRDLIAKSLRPDVKKTSQQEGSEEGLGKGGGADGEEEEEEQEEEQEEEEEGCSEMEALSSASDSVVMLFLLYERKRGVESHWCDFLKMLPREMPTGMCSSEDVSEHLVGTPASQRIEMEKQVITSSYSGLFPMLADT
jgi:hypothetical protein